MSVENLRNIDVGDLNRRGCAFKGSWSNWIIGHDYWSMPKLPSDFDYSATKNGAIDGALCGQRKDHCRELPIHRCAGLAQARLSSIATAVLIGLEAGWRAGGVDQCQDGTTSRNPEIPKSPLRWGLD
jgi:hypothetical protein